MREITGPADRAARVRADIARIFLEPFDHDEFFGRVEDIVREVLTEAEIDIRAEYLAE
jgi:hypothetical protein